MVVAKFATEESSKTYLPESYFVQIKFEEVQYFCRLRIITVSILNGSRKSNP